MKNEIKEITAIITRLQDCGRKRISQTEGVIVNNKDIATALYKAGYRKIDGDTSDGYHTFNELYHHRAVLFTMICNQNKEIAWKSKKHSDGTMFDNMFIVGIETPAGQATYHYDIEPYWDYFNVKELDNAPLWDGHTAEQAIERIRLMADDIPIVRTKAEVVKEFAEVLDKAGYRKQSDTVKEFAEKIIAVINDCTEDYLESLPNLYTKIYVRKPTIISEIKQLAEQFGKEEK